MLQVTLEVFDMMHIVLPDKSTYGSPEEVADILLKLTDRRREKDSDIFRRAHCGYSTVTGFSQLNGTIQQFDLIVLSDELPLEEIKLFARHHCHIPMIVITCARRKFRKCPNVRSLRFL